MPSFVEAIQDSDFKIVTCQSIWDPYLLILVTHHTYVVYLNHICTKHLHMDTVGIIKICKALQAIRDALVANYSQVHGHNMFMYINYVWLSTSYLCTYIL